MVVILLFYIAHELRLERFAYFSSICYHVPLYDPKVSFLFRSHLLNSLVHHFVITG
jgi:hypothetical protein